MNRRLLLLTGGAAVVVLGAGWAMTREPKEARAPWRQAGESFGDPRLDILAYAILAPNPHNMQPWRIRLDGEDAFTVFCDLDRTLPETDPPNRQITIGFGCFLELARMAAAERGYAAAIEYFPEGEPYPLLDERPIARVTLREQPTVITDPLFSEALGRRTNRQPFDTARAPSADDLQAIEAASLTSVQAETSSDAELVAALRKIAVDAWRIEWTTPRTRRESIIVTRIGKQAINEHPNGIALPGAPMDLMKATGLLTNEKMDVPGSAAYEQSLEFYEKACQTAMGFAWMKTAGNTRSLQLETGRSWVRMQLAAMAQGVSFHPLSQSLQEFPEMAGPYREVHELLGAGEGETVQMLTRLGFAKTPPAAPREPITSKIIPA